jgi:hypothetical protein
VDHLLEQLPDHPSAPAPPKPAEADAPVPARVDEIRFERDEEDLISKVDDMSDEQVDALLERIQEEEASGRSVNQET